MSENIADAELVARAQQGDKNAFNLLVLRYQRRVAGVVSRYVRDPSEALDVVQEAFIKAYRALPQFPGAAVSASPGNQPAQSTWTLCFCLPRITVISSGASPGIRVNSRCTSSTLDVMRPFNATIRSPGVNPAWAATLPGATSKTRTT